MIPPIPHAPSRQTAELSAAPPASIFAKEVHRWGGKSPEYLINQLKKMQVGELRTLQKIQIIVLEMSQ
jgi:hypothetical protein